MKLPNVLCLTGYSVRFAFIASLVLLTVAACSPEAERYNEKGNEHFGKSSFEDALAEYQLAQVDEPDVAEPYYNAANAYNRMNQPEEVLTQTKQAVKTAESDLASQAWYNLGNAYFDAEQWPQAVEAYQDALRLEPGDLDAKVNLELALQNMQQAEQQQQQEDQSEEQQEQEGQEDQSEQGEQEEESSQSENESASSEDQEGQEDEAAQQSEETEGMTEDQAIQLLQALLDDSQTLQEKLQEIHQSPGPSSEQDW